MATSKKLMGTTAVGGGPLAIEDVFSTYLYTGNGSTQTITNGIDLAGEGGMVWVKDRSVASDHRLFDTENGAGTSLISNGTFVLQTSSQTSFTSSGFGVGSLNDFNLSGSNFASWTFRKAPRFFDVVTYTGDGSTQVISHNLKTEVGAIFVKCTSQVVDWLVWNRNLPTYNFMKLNTTAAYSTSAAGFKGATDTTFTVGGTSSVNQLGETYVAYLFAHDPLGPSGDGSDGLIACGSYTGNGSEAVIDLGWEPQWLLIKDATKAGAWVMLDNMRGMSETSQYFLQAEASSAENTSQTLYPRPTSTGFRIPTATNDYVNQSGQTFIYIAIRRGPMRQPTSGTEVFKSTVYTGNGSTTGQLLSMPDMSYADASIVETRGSPFAGYHMLYDRLRGDTNYLLTRAASAEATSDRLEFDVMKALNAVYVNSVAPNYSGQPYVAHSFKRAPGFFDVVAYTGDGVAGRTVSHNLGVAPEMMIVKSRSSAYNWTCYHKDIGVDNVLLLNYNWAATTLTTAWNSTHPDADTFTLGNVVTINGSGNNCIAYLFTTLPGVSKVGSYTGNGTSQTIDCGFTSGARFVLIKRTDSAGDWYVWDTARGIVAANDPHLSLNTTAAEVTTDDSIDPDSSGFVVNQNTATNINVSSASYIYLAIA